MRDDWQQSNHPFGELLNDKDTQQHAKIVQSTPRMKAAQHMGVKMELVLSSIPINHYIVPILNITIGKGNVFFCVCIFYHISNIIIFLLIQLQEMIL